MPSSSRRQFLSASVVGASYFAAAGTRRAWSQSANERPQVACIGVGGKGGSDSDNAALFGDVIAICDVDRGTLESKGKAEKFRAAERFTDYRELFAKLGDKLDLCTVSTPDHMHAPATLEAMRLGIGCYTQKPLTRTIYEARLLAKVAAEKGVVTQMGNQGTALDSSREAIAQIKSGVLGPLQAVHAWSNRPVWAQGPGRRMNLRKYQIQAMRQGISCYTQKPLTRTIYEARLLTNMAKEMADKGVVTQMGNQGTALDSSREAIAQIKTGVLGPLKEVYAWSNRPVWAQGPGRRMNVRKYQTQAMKEVDEQEDTSITAEEVSEIVSDLVKKKQQEIGKALERVDWKAWLGVAPSREFWPGLYHSFQHRGWWDFGTGALGDMACHQLTVPYAACGLRDPVSVVARTTGHDFDSFPASSIIRFEFPETAERPAIPFWWYDRKGNKPPMEVFSKWGIDTVSDSGVLVVGEKGAFYSTDD